MAISELASSVPQRSLLRATSLVSLMTFLSRIIGFARDMLMAQLFGAGAGMDAFYIAFRIPNFMRRLFAEGAFSQAFVPVLSEYQKTRSHEDVRHFLARIAGSLSAILTLVTLLGVLSAPWVIDVFAPGFHHDAMRARLATEMLRITFPYLMLISLTAMSGATLNTFGYFGVPAFTPVLLNISMISCALWLSPQMDNPPVALAWGVLLGGIAQFMFQLPFLFKHRLLYFPKLKINDDGVRRVLRLMVPALFGVSIAQINLMIDTIFASFLQVGSVTWLFLTDRLTDFPLGVFGVAIATVILPHLSKRYAEQNTRYFSQSMDWGLRMLLIIGVPSALGLMTFSLPMIAACFGYGAFKPFDLLQTQKSLMMLSFGLPAFMIVKVLASGFYAQQNIKTPVKIGVVCMVFNTLCCALLVGPLAHAGLTLASAIASYLNCFILFFLLCKRKIYQPQAGWGKFIVQLLVANALMGIYLYYTKGTLLDWLDKPMLLRLGYLLAHILVAIVIYVMTLRIVGLRYRQFRGPTREI